jgi:hypothetical protein
MNLAVGRLALQPSLECKYKPRIALCFRHLLRFHYFTRSYGPLSVSCMRRNETVLLYQDRLADVSTADHEKVLGPSEARDAPCFTCHSCFPWHLHPETLLLDDRPLCRKAYNEVSPQ